MSRLPRDARLETREARRRLKQRHEPYWRQIHPGLFVGYRKGKRGGVWIVRRLVDDRYVKRRIAKADDLLDANDADILSYAQANKRAVLDADTAAKAEAARRDPDYTVNQALDDYVEWFRINAKSLKQTIQTIDAHIRPKFGKERIADLTSPRIKRWQQGLVRAPVRKRGKRIAVTDDPGMIRRRKATANRIMSVFKAALNHAYQNDRIESDNAWRRVKPFKGVDAPRVRFLTPDECRRLVEACEPEIQPLVQAALLTGCRYGELAQLVCRDFHAEAQSLYIAESKSGKPRHVPLTDEGLALFESLTAGKHPDDLILTREAALPWGRSHQTRPIREACQRAGIDPPVSFHILRHTYGSLLALNGTPLQVIAEVLGHADTRTTQKHYAHLMPSYVGDTIRANLPKLGISAGRPRPSADPREPTIIH